MTVYPGQTVPPGEDPGGSGGDRRTRRRNLGILVAGILVGFLGLAVPVLLLALVLVRGDDAGEPWSSTPETLTGEAATEAAATCRDRYPPHEGRAAVVSADRRGEFTYVLITGPGYEASCLMHDDLLEDFDVEKLGSGYVGHYTTDPAADPVLASDAIEENHSGQGTISVPGRVPFTSVERALSWVEGYAGRDVAGVTVHTSSGQVFEASIDGNRFAAWWPSRNQSSRVPAETWWYTVRLADGGVRTVD